MLTYSPSIVAASAKVLEESATPDMQVTFASGSFKGGQIGELEETPGLSAGAWQMRPCRAAMSRPSRTGRERRRRSTRAISWRKPTGAPSSAVCDLLADVRRTRAEAIRPRRDPAGRTGPERGRIARRWTAQWRHLLS